MNKRKKRVRRLYKYHKKYNFHLLNKISRILSWLLPGLVIKRWMLTSAIGFLTSLLGLSIWTNLSPLYWFTEIFFGLLTGLTKILPVSVLGPLIFVIVFILIGLLILIFKEIIITLLASVFILIGVLIFYYAFI